MRDFSKIVTSIWGSKRFRSLPEGSDSQLLYFYFHTCKHVTSIGCYELPVEYIRADMKPHQSYWSDTRIHTCIEALRKAGLIEYNYDEEVLFIYDFLEKSPLQNPKHAVGAAKLALALPNCFEKYLVLKDLMADPRMKDREELQDFINANLSQFDTSIDTGIDTGMDTTETETETETERETDSSFVISDQNPELSLTPPDQQPDDPISEIFDQWNKYASDHSLPTCRKLTNERRACLKRRLSEAIEVLELEHQRSFSMQEAFTAVLDVISQSPHLLGKNDRGWRCNLDFVCNKSSFHKIIDGQYVSQASSMMDYLGEPTDPN